MHESDVFGEPKAAEGGSTGISRRTLLTGAASAVTFGGLQRASGRPSTREQQILESLTKDLFSSLGTPGLWCAVYVRDALVAEVAVGNRRESTKEAAGAGDRLMWGSISKAVGGTAVGAIVEQGRLTYETKLRDVFPEIPSTSSLLDATVAQFMVHHSGLSNTVPWQKTDPKDARAWRLAYLRTALETETVDAPGSRYSYAPGVDVVAAMVERVCRRDFASIQRELLWVPGGLGSVRYGWPDEGGVYGHVPNPDGTWKESLRADFSANYAAAGGISGTIADLARFGALHANSRLRGLPSIGRNTFARLHSHLVEVDGESAKKWGATTLSGLNGWPHGNLMHDGMWYRGDYAMLVCSPRRRVSVAMYRNSHREPGKADFGELMDKLCEAIPILHYAYSGPV